MPRLLMLVAAAVVLSRLCVATSERCQTAPGLNKQQCDKLIENGCSVAWVGLGCLDGKGHRLKDGGCQTLTDGAYCKWKCRDKCDAHDNCVWIDNECKYQGCSGIETSAFSPPENVMSLAGLTGLRPLNWASDGIGFPLNVSQSYFCGIQLYAIASRDIDTRQVGNLDLRIFGGLPGSFADPAISYMRLALTKIVARGRLGHSPLRWYELRYALSPSQSTMVPRSMFSVIRFPAWRNAAFSLLSITDPDSSSICPVSIGDTTFNPVSSCQYSGERQRLFIKVFA